MVTGPASSKVADDRTMPGGWLWVIGFGIAFLVVFFAFIVLNLEEACATVVAAFVGLVSMVLFFLDSSDREARGPVWSAGLRGLTGALAVFSLCLPLVDLVFDGGEFPDLGLLQLHEGFALVLLGVMIFVILACIVFPLMGINRNIRSTASESGTTNTSTGARAPGNGSSTL